MKKLLVCFGLILLLTGCGHNIVQVDRGIGIDLRIPIPYSGENIVSLKIGQIDSTSLVLRGNTKFNSQSETSGSTQVGKETSADGKGIITQKINFTAGSQLNEGYLKDVLIDQNLSTEDKIKIIKILNGEKK